MEVKCCAAFVQFQNYIIFYSRIKTFELLAHKNDKTENILLVDFNIWL